MYFHLYHQRKTANIRIKLYNYPCTDAGKIGIKDTGGNKPVLVMVPDGLCVIEHFESLITELLPYFRVICFDMPGLGFSYPKLNYDFGLAKSTKIIISVLDALKIERATLSFSCVNGYVAIAVSKKLSGTGYQDSIFLDPLSG